MNLIPAIDLYQGECVRLNQGKFNQITNYKTTPLETALCYKRQGAKFLHLVDLNGAKEGRSVQLDMILKIKKKTLLKIQVGGGFRNKETIANTLENGIDRIIIGSLAVTNFKLTKSLFIEYGVNRFVLAVDVIFEKNPLVMIHGWQEKTKVNLWDLLKKYNSFKQLHILCTDINRDGMLKGPNLSLYRNAVKKFPNLKFQASAGIKDLDDLIKLKKIGITDAIIGKALYENYFFLDKAIEKVESC